MELRHLRYFMVVGEEQHYGRASRRLRVAQPALSRQIQDLEDELGFKLFDRLPRGVKLSAAGRLFLEDTRRILQDVSEATARAARVARGQSGTLRVGFAENASWHGVVPDSFRRFRERQLEAELAWVIPKAEALSTRERWASVGTYSAVTLRFQNALDVRPRNHHYRASRDRARPKILRV